MHGRNARQKCTAETHGSRDAWYQRRTVSETHGIRDARPCVSTAGLEIKKNLVIFGLDLLFSKSYDPFCFV
jgi:hypothetical protein